MAVKTVMWVLMPMALALGGCGYEAALGTSTEAAQPSSPAVATASVELWHCGVVPVSVEGRPWEAPDQMVDGDSTLPLDATNTPTGWVGRGTALVTGDKMTYTDEGGEVIDFVPDDGSPPVPCA